MNKGENVFKSFWHEKYSRNPGEIFPVIFTCKYFAVNLMPTINSIRKWYFMQIINFTGKKMSK